MFDVRNLIAGSHCGARAGRTLPIAEPATGARIGAAPASTGEDIDAAVQAATRAFPSWARAPAIERGRLLERLATLIESNLERLARAESIDTGKPVALARRVDIPRSAANMRYFAQAMQHCAGEAHWSDGASVPGAAPALNVTRRRPRGVAGCISPWNLPLYLFTWKIAPALASGNTVVSKPSELTPVTAHLLGELSIEAGFPPGVLNIVHGTGAEAGAALVMHPGVQTITFTGSTSVGRWIARVAGDAFKRVSLELGGKNPFIIFEDAALDGERGAIATASRAAFTNQGQICLCGSRVLAHRSIHQRVREGLIARARALKVGDPLDDATEFGALVSEPHLAKVARCVDAARSLGGRVLTGGSRIDPAHIPARCRGGAFYAPTIIEGLPPGCTVEQEEIFGPVITLHAFDREEEAIDIANGTRYGLAATIFTRDMARAHRAGAALDAGIVWVNCWMNRDLRTPFGGMKESGVGREGGLDAIRFFTEPTNLCFALDDSV